MLALALTNKKDFMNKFLKTEIFDHFLLQEGIVVSFASYVIDGTITKGFYTDTEAEELGIKTFHFLPFSMLRPRIFDLIKGKKAPSSFKFVLMLSPENQKRTMERIGSSYTPGGYFRHVHVHQISKSDAYTDYRNFLPHFFHR